MITKGIKPYNKLIINILSGLSNINKRRKDFLVEIFVLLLSVKGRINFLQLSRYGNYKDTDKNYFCLIEQKEDATIHCAEVYFKSLKRIIKLVHVIYKNKLHFQ